MNYLVAPLLADFIGKPVWIWLLFVTLVALLLAFDLGVLHRKAREIGIAESLWLSAGYLGLAAAFGGWVWWYLGAEPGMQYFTGLMVEKSLSMDNVFVMSLVFTYFAIPRLHQHRVLFWGILGVVVLRGIMIGFGTALISSFHWMLYLFAGFLVLTGIRMLFGTEAPPDVSKNPLLALLRRRLNVTDTLHGQRFFVRLPGAGGRAAWFATPLFLALVLIEFADVVFAVDSVPAVLSITTDPFIVYTSNVFAVLGLRALYFALAAVVHRFHLLKFALAAVLVFIGGKLFYGELVGKVDPAVSLGVTFSLLAAGIVASLAATGRDPIEEPGQQAAPSADSRSRR